MYCAKSLTHLCFSLQQYYLFQLYFQKRKEIDDKLEKNINSIIEFATQLRNVGSIIPFESIVEKDSIAVGKSIGALDFWHNTKATIIAVKRNGDMFLSPGPYFIINERDIIVYVGDDSVLETVKNYISLPLANK